MPAAVVVVEAEREDRPASRYFRDQAVKPRWKRKTARNRPRGCRFKPCAWDTGEFMKRYAHLRFEEKIERVGKCWLWRGCKNSAGYGFLLTGSRKDGTRRKEAAHVFSYRFYNGPVPQGMVVYRKCTTAGCVNPEHLRCGTRSEMVRAAVKAGRWPQGDASTFPSTKGEKNGRAKLSDAVRRLIAQDRQTKALILARRHQVSEQTIYKIQASPEYRTPVSGRAEV